MGIVKESHRICQIYTIIWSIGTFANLTLLFAFKIYWFAPIKLIPLIIMIVYLNMIKRKLLRQKMNNRDVQLNLCNVNDDNVDDFHVNGRCDSFELNNRQQAMYSSVSSSTNYKWSSYPLYFNSKPINATTASMCILPILMRR